MKILFTGGGTGGHFYPLIAVAEAMREQARREKLLPPQFYFMSPSKYNPRALFDNEITYVYVPAGKMRKYFSFLNFTDTIVTAIGCFKALISVYRIFPDIVFAKGGYTTFPALWAARILRIPVIIHESDSSPGRVNLWASKFAEKIAISYPGAVEGFPPKTRAKIAYTGNPIRKEILLPITKDSHSYFKIDETVPTILFLGGSQGSQKINDLIIDSAPELLKNYNIIHQTGRANFASVKKTMDAILYNHPNKFRYVPKEYLSDLDMRTAVGASTVIVSRAGSTIFEIAHWGKPSIIIPISKEISHDQTSNALAYARKGACLVIEEFNLTAHLFISELTRIMTNPQILENMSVSAKAFSREDSADVIARVILETALSHEK